MCISFYFKSPKPPQNFTMYFKKFSCCIAANFEPYFSYHPIELNGKITCMFQQNLLTCCNILKLLIFWGSVKFLWLKIVCHIKKINMSRTCKINFSDKLN